MNGSDYQTIIGKVKGCTLCSPYLSFEPRPVFQIHPKAKVLIAGQAPGSKVHATGIPFNDPSGDRLRNWMGIDKDLFYNSEQIAILPMGFAILAQENLGTCRHARNAQISGVTKCLH